MRSWIGADCEFVAQEAQEAVSPPPPPRKRVSNSSGAGQPQGPSNSVSSVELIAEKPRPYEEGMLREGMLEVLELEQREKAQHGDLEMMRELCKDKGEVAGLAAALIRDMEENLVDVQQRIQTKLMVLRPEAQPGNEYLMEMIR